MQLSRRLPSALAVAILWPIAGLCAGPETGAEQIFKKPLKETQLADERGGHQDDTVETQIFNTITLDGNMDNVRVSNVSTGDNSITQGAFSNSSGFPMVIQNSGNGVLIQNATILNVTIQP